MIAILLIGLLTPLMAQKATGYAAISKTMSRIPDSLTRSTRGIASYVNSKFPTQREQSRAIFIWIARNISYNFDSLFTNRYGETPSEVSERILRTRVGVCLNFATLFNEISNKAGIRSYLIQGYTKQGGRVDYLPHVWCAGYLDSAWYLTDPTWGAGYVYKGRFVNQVNNFYFMADPEDLIRSHMPFDPVWQLLYHPLTHQEFYKSYFRVDKNRPYFNFPDSLAVFERASELDRAISAARRIEKYGVKNDFIATKLRVLKGEIVYYRNKTATERYDSAVNRYNEGIIMLNRFIHIRNEQFQPVKDSLHFRQLLDSTEYHFMSAMQTLAGINAPEESIAVSVIQLNNAISGTMMILNEQKAFLDSTLRNRR